MACCFHYQKPFSLIRNWSEWNGAVLIPPCAACVHIMAQKWLSCAIDKSRAALTPAGSFSAQIVQPSSPPTPHPPLPPMTSLPPLSLRWAISCYWTKSEGKGGGEHGSSLICWLINSVFFSFPFFSFLNNPRSHSIIFLNADRERDVGQECSLRAGWNVLGWFMHLWGLSLNLLLLLLFEESGRGMRGRDSFLLRGKMGEAEQTFWGNPRVLNSGCFHTTNWLHL